MTDPELAWVAGLLEGEGCFLLVPKRTKSGGSYFSARVSCNMTDLDVLQRLQSLIGGRICGPYNDNPSRHKDHYRWNLHRRGEIEVLLRALLPLMGTRRSEKIKTILDFALAHPAKNKNAIGYAACGVECDEDDAPAG